MKPLFILVIVFIASLTVTFSLDANPDVLLSGTIALSSMLIFTSIGHFIFTEGMSKMILPWIKYKNTIVYTTGIFEVIAAIIIFIPSMKLTIGIMLIIFFIMVLPANIYAALNKVNYETGRLDGKGLQYLWFRIPFQIVSIFWTYYFLVRQVGN